jgi:hypothetical protein
VTVNNELNGICKDAVVTKVNVLARRGGTEEKYDSSVRTILVPA